MLVSPFFCIFERENIPHQLVNPILGRNQIEDKLKEFTEIQIGELKTKSQEELLREKYLSFDSLESDLPYSKYLGKPISLEKGILKLSTQMYYEKIPLSEMNKGTRIEFFSNSRKAESWGDGIVHRKYFVQAKKEDWKIKTAIDESNSTEIITNIKLNSKEKEVLEFGETPLSMDDKWFVYCSDNEFHFYRSWTGIEIFKGEMTKSTLDHGQWEINKVSVSNEWNVSLEEKKELIQDLLMGGIRRKLEVY